MRTAGLVLCGGRSSRMGQSKAWLPFKGEAMLSRVVRLLSQVVTPVVVVAAPGQNLPPLSTETVVVRDPLEGQGPLRGLATGLEALAGQADAVFLSSCDVPFLQPALVRRLVELLGDKVICVPEAGGYRHPLTAVYRAEVAGEATTLLNENRLSLMGLFERVPTRFAQPEELTDVDPMLRSLRNLNTPADYEQALREMELTHLFRTRGDD